MIPYIEGLSAANWQKSSRTARHQSLVQLEHALAAQENREPCLVELDPAGDSPYDGRYDPETKTIHITEDYVKNNTPYQAVHTLLEESRHAYQHDAVLKNDSSRAENEEQFNDWKMAYTGGKLSGKPDLEKWQPVEVDARKSANQGVVEMYGESSDGVKEIFDLQQDTYRDESGELQERARQAVAETYAAKQIAPAMLGLGNDTVEPSLKEGYDHDQSYGF